METVEIKNALDVQKIRVNGLVDLKRLRSIAEQRVQLEPTMLKLIDEVVERIEQGRFSVAVVGEFKRGKSTFINALLGKGILPSDVLPCSATLNRVTYSLEPSVEVVYKGTEDQPGRTEKIGIEQLTDYVTKLTPESEETAANIKEAVVYYPLESLKNGVDIIDTPGLNDDEAMTDVTLEVIPVVDTAILVMMADAPFSQYEADFLNSQLLLNDMGRIIFVVNAIDRMRSEDERDRVLEAIKKRIRTSVHKRLAEQFGKDSDEFRFYEEQIGDPKVYGLSSYDALTAKVNNDAELMARSNFTEFERVLHKFLAETRGAVELKVLAARTIGAGDEILKKLEMEAGALEMGQSEFNEAYQTASTELESLRQRRDLEFQKIDEAAERTKKAVGLFVLRLDEDIKIAAATAIDNTIIRPAELKNIESLLDKLGQKVTHAIQKVSRQFGDQIQLEIERDLMKEIDRLENFTSLVNKALQNIEIQFAPKKQRKVSQTLALSSIGWFGLGGLVEGYKEAGGKGAAIGGSFAFGTFVVGVNLLGLLALPPLIPLVAMGVVATFAGKWLTQNVFAGDRAEKFKEDYKKQVLEQIGPQLQAERVDLKVDKSIETIYQALKDKIVGEMVALIEQTQSTLNELRSKKEREETLSEHRLEENNELQSEVENIRNKALWLADQLTDIGEI